MTAETRQRIIYLASDLVTTSLAVLLFSVIRYYNFTTEDFGSLSGFLVAPSIIKGQIFLPLMMLAIFAFSGYYYHTLSRSRVDDLINTLVTTGIGALIIYLAIIANDSIADRGTVFEIIFTLWGLMFGCVYAARFFITYAVVKRMHSRRYGFNTLIIGTTQAAISMAERLNNMRNSMGFNIVGFVDLGCSDICHVSGAPVYSIDDLAEVCSRENIESLIVMPHPYGVHATMALINKLYPIGCGIYVPPILFQVISGRSTFHNVAGEPLVDVSRPDISASTVVFKRTADIVGSLLALVVISPLLIALSVAVKCSSPGPVLYKQERIGYRKRRFKIIKFRSMYVDAEADGPALSSLNDPRVTRVGAFMRKYRLDELPQFWNILRGEMSIVGPRPEREYYVKQIVERVPYYTLIHSVRPGLTSWGMVKYGYATDVDEMIERLKYDLIYIENVSVGIDLKIIIYTIKTVITGKGL